MNLYPAISLSDVVYEFTCECDARCEGRTSRRLDGMREHVPLAITKGTDRCNGRCQPKRKCKVSLAISESDSAIGTHLLSSNECGKNYSQY